MPKDKQKGKDGEEITAESPKEMNKEEKKETTNLEKIASLQVELEKAKADTDHWKNEYYRAFADTQNLRKSLEEDHRNAVKYRAEGFIESLIPALDAFHSALSCLPNGEEAKNYRTGFEYIYRQIASSLENEGVKELIPNAGDRFDASFMHAVDTVESEGEENRVVAVLAKGYQLKDRMIRPVMVSVSKKKEATKDVAPEESPKTDDESVGKETINEANKA